MAKPGRKNLITDVAGLRVGAAHDEAARTGVTVLLADAPFIAAADVRGGAPGSRDIEGLDPVMLAPPVDALVLSGGSVFGLDAAGGVTGWLATHGRGFAIAPGAPLVPITPSAILFDIANGGDKNWANFRLIAHWGAQPRLRRRRISRSARRARVTAQAAAD